MVPETVIVILPLPPKVLSPNCPTVTLRGRFAKHAAARKQARLTKEAIEEEQIETAPWGKATVKPTFYHKTKRSRDTDNAIGSLKAAYDAVVEAGLIPDDTPEFMERLEPNFLVDKEWPRVVLKIARAE